MYFSNSFLKKIKQLTTFKFKINYFPIIFIKISLLQILKAIIITIIIQLINPAIMIIRTKYSKINNNSLSNRFSKTQFNFSNKKINFNINKTFQIN